MKTLTLTWLLGSALLTFLSGCAASDDESTGHSPQQEAALHSGYDPIDRMRSGTRY